jgi:hypothetical protein
VERLARHSGVELGDERGIDGDGCLVVSLLPFATRGENAHNPEHNEMIGFHLMLIKHAALDRGRLREKG